jgi:hypothetical protein
MGALGKFGGWRHGVVLASGVGVSVLAYAGVIGSGSHEEKFDAKQVLVTPAGGDGVRIREVVDEDFGNHDRHGYERIIPNDFGEPIDVEASSPDAPEQVSVTPLGDSTRIRIGDASKTVDGQHRYVLSYTLPDAQITSGKLALDIIGTDEDLQTDRFEVIVAGLQLQDPLCSIGSFGTTGGCTLSPDGDVLRTVISPLKPNQGITIGGTITSTTGAVDVPEPAIPKRRSDNHLPLALGMLPLAAVGGGSVFAWARRKGRNEVAGGGAADAAYGDQAGLQAPPDYVRPASAAQPMTRMVPDSRMSELATTEFVPPKGLAPWQGAVLLRETIDTSTVQAWFSGLAAVGIIDLQRKDGVVTMSRGTHFDTAPDTEAEILGGLFAGRDTITLGTYDKRFADAWKSARAKEVQAIGASGWWRSGVPGGSAGSGLAGGIGMMAILWFFILGGAGLTAIAGSFRGLAAALAFGLIVPAIAAFAVYHSLLPARSATGSALALRTESFRRFLAASEGKHVEWAWKNNILREYSAWAVALGAADTWQHAMEASGVPQAEYTTGPMVIWYAGPLISRSYTAPAPAGGGGGSGFSGFSGGSVGGGGGGGSSGSW